MLSLLSAEAHQKRKDRIDPLCPLYLSEPVMLNQLVEARAKMTKRQALAETLTMNLLRVLWEKRRHII